MGHYGPPSTGRIQQLAYKTNHKQRATKLFKLLNKYLDNLVIVTFENGKNYLICLIFDWIQNETRKLSYREDDPIMRPIYG